ncbi:hypothetical protein PROFUN_08332 [Planoprotostelium fungivorum]|uniref:Thioredoxin domain-containing protein n=1 Tax=Planoprotostelium fungivorum TaxID=1890364 RepID=A0A2P6NI16_9EUKA|nr:hypothetical protein PROFUN_08332 [Planoprotostelium fungivorum]
MLRLIFSHTKPNFTRRIRHQSFERCWNGTSSDVRVSRDILWNHRMSSSSQGDSQLRHTVWKLDVTSQDSPVSFGYGNKWLNTKDEEPLYIDSLKGKLLLLEFWTSCCINCHHSEEETSILRKEFKDDEGMVFLGVHSPKFPSEREEETLRMFLKNTGMTQPVVHDVDRQVWKSFGVRCWPTFIVISPEGNLLYKWEGEGKMQEMRSFLRECLGYYRQKGLIDEAPLHRQTDEQSDITSPPLFISPGKLAVDHERQRLFVSDSGQNKIFVVRADGEVIDVIGSGERGFSDGNLTSVAFNRQQGICYDDTRDHLYVADTRNHSLRRVDLSAGHVTTIAGDSFFEDENLEDQEQRMASPWDVCMDKRDKEGLFVAMAGSHQIWRHDLKDGKTWRISGTGQERSLNNRVKIESADWAQPSGLCLNSRGDVLYVADAESSSVRGVNFEENYTFTLAGGDPDYPINLFAYGDVDGGGREARFQHPTALLKLNDHRLFVADTYNNKIKCIDTNTNTVTTLFGQVTAAPAKTVTADLLKTDNGKIDGKRDTCRLYHPSALALMRDQVYVADTNNGCIRR